MTQQPDATRSRVYATPHDVDPEAVTAADLEAATEVTEHVVNPRLNRPAQATSAAPHTPPAQAAEIALATVPLLAQALQTLIGTIRVHGRMSKRGANEVWEDMQAVIGLVQVLDAALPEVMLAPEVLLQRVADDLAANRDAFRDPDAVLDAVRHYLDRTPVGEQEVSDG